MKHAARRKKRIQRQPVSAAISEALATELWFRSNLQQSSKRLGQQELIADILRWYLPLVSTQPQSYAQAQSSGIRLTFWLNGSLIDRYRAIARRDGVTKRQVMASAFDTYVRHMISPNLTRFRHQTLSRMHELYKRERARPRLTSRD